MANERKKKVTIDWGTVFVGIKFFVVVCLFEKWIWWITAATFNLRTGATWVSMILPAAVLIFIVAFAVTENEYDDYNWKIVVAGWIFLIAALLILAIVCFFNGDFMRANKNYAIVSDMVTVVEGQEEAVFPDLNTKDNTMPFVGEPEALKRIQVLLNKDASRGSRFTIDDDFTSQLLNNELVYVEELEPTSWNRWDKEKGSDGYYIVSRTSQDAEFINKTLYYTQNAPFGSMAKRIIRSQYDGLFTELSPEVDDNGVFHYVATTYTQDGPNAMKIVTGVVIFNAEEKNPEVKWYSLDEIPEWVERVYPEEFFEEYCKTYGLYKHGRWNTIFGKLELEEATADYDVVYIGDSCYYYTGWTSVGADNSSSGIMMQNVKTGEMTLYRTGGGLDEQYAQQVAEDKVQNYGYKASYPLLISVGGHKTMFMIMRGDNNNVAGYSFVNYTDSQKVAFADTIQAAQAAYLKMFNNNGFVLNDSDIVYVNGAISDIASEVKDGNTIYYVKISGSDKIFAFYSELAPTIVFSAEGTPIKVGYVENENVVINAVEVTLDGITTNIEDVIVEEDNVELTE